MGKGSNLLIADRGFPGLVVTLAPGGGVKLKFAAAGLTKSIWV